MSKANDAEVAAFKKMKKMLGNPDVIAEPMGSAAGFPDFGFRMILSNKKIDIHVEYKLDSKAQMGSMRDWHYTKNGFHTTDTENDEKTSLITIMNDSQDAKKKADVLLKAFQKHFDSKITDIYSGMLTIISDKKLRRTKLLNFVHNYVDNYQIAKISNTTLGNGIISHYKKKFAKSKNRDADGSILLMMIGNSLYIVDKDTGIKDSTLKQLKEYFGGTIPSLTGLQAALEIRIQPRGLSSSDNPVSIDVMASFRLSGGLANGLNI
jgi:hypothetical protein